MRRPRTRLLLAVVALAAVLLCTEHRMLALPARAAPLAAAAGEAPALPPVDPAGNCAPLAVKFVTYSPMSGAPAGSLDPTLVAVPGYALGEREFRPPPPDQALDTAFVAVLPAGSSERDLARFFCGRSGSEGLACAAAVAQEHFAMVAFDDQPLAAARVLQKKFPGLLSRLLPAELAPPGSLPLRVPPAPGPLGAWLRARFTAQAKACAARRPATEEVSALILSGDFPASDTCALPAVPELRWLAGNATALTRDCDVVAFSSAFFGPGELLADPRRKLDGALAAAERLPPALAAQRLCYVLIAGPSSAAVLRRPEYAARLAPWRLLEMSVAADEATAGRKLSKVVKHAPHLFFRAARTVFVDFKLELHEDPRALLAAHLPAAGGAGAAFVRHPCTAPIPEASADVMGLCKQKPTQKDRRPPSEWLFTEADIVLSRSKTATPRPMQQQIARYRALAGRGYDLTTFADTALVLRDAAVPASRALGCRWAHEFLRADSSDRDQPALAYVLGSDHFAFPSGVVMLDAAAHWWYTDRVAELGAKLCSGGESSAAVCDFEAEAKRLDGVALGRKRKRGEVV